jgi:hypothetical protein
MAIVNTRIRRPLTAGRARAAGATQAALSASHGGESLDPAGGNARAGGGSVGRPATETVTAGPAEQAEITAMLKTVRITPSS